MQKPKIRCHLFSINVHIYELAPIVYRVHILFINNLRAIKKTKAKLKSARSQYRTNEVIQFLMQVSPSAHMDGVTLTYLRNYIYS